MGIDKKQPSVTVTLSVNECATVYRALSTLAFIKRRDVLAILIEHGKESLRDAEFVALLRKLRTGYFT